MVRWHSLTDLSVLAYLINLGVWELFRPDQLFFASRNIALAMANDSTRVLEIGAVAPPFSLQGTDGDTHSLEDFQDASIVVIVFTCNHCPYAKAKQPALNDIAAAYDDVAVIGINPNDPAQYPEDSFESMQDVVAEGIVTLDAYLFDETQDVAAAYGAVCTPDPFVFERNDDEALVLVYHGRIDDAMKPDDEPSEEPGFLLRSVLNAIQRGEAIPVDAIPARGCSIKWKPGNEPDWWNSV